jgi:hypothetical protein
MSLKTQRSRKHFQKCTTTQEFRYVNKVKSLRLSFSQISLIALTFGQTSRDAEDIFQLPKCSAEAGPNKVNLNLRTKIATIKTYFKLNRQILEIVRSRNKRSSTRFSKFIQNIIEHSRSTSYANLNKYYLNA